MRHSQWPKPTDMCTAGQLLGITNWSPPCQLESAIHSPDPRLSNCNPVLHPGGHHVELRVVDRSSLLGALTQEAGPAGPASGVTFVLKMSHRENIFMVVQIAIPLFDILHYRSIDLCPDLCTFKKRGIPPN
jgi:hypothetical protein